jgi:hypothetical protein
MLSRIRRRFTYANVLASIALFVSLAGGTYAAIRVSNAKRVNGSTVKQIHYHAHEGSPAKKLFALGGLKVKASCPAGDNVVVTATTNRGKSIIGVSPAGGVLTDSGGVDDVFRAGEQHAFGFDDFTGDLSYGRGPKRKPVVTATFLANKYSQTTECTVVGTVVGG